ncbi:MAG: Ig-like domain-containing protein, partial [Candidatus Peribacteraceae bacterium]|nr:Ig-like domain-containing protein [Candidatus Peribacteraceae bacterium]
DFSSGVVEGSNISYCGFDVSNTGFKISTDGVNVFNSSFDMGFNGLFLGTETYIFNTTVTNMENVGIQIVGFNPVIENITIENTTYGTIINFNSQTHKNISIDECFRGLTVSNSDATFENCSLVDCQIDMRLSSGSDITFLNVTDNNTYDFNTADTSLTKKWFQNTKVIDPSFAPIDGATVTIKDNVNGTFDENFTTDATGWVRWIVVNESYDTQAGKILYTSHNVSVSKGLLSNGTVPEQVMNESKWLTVVLEDDSPPTINSISPANNSIDVSVNTVIDVEFSESMGQTSSQNAFSLRKNGTAIDVPGTFSWAGTTMTFIPDSALDFGANYTCNVTTTAEDSNGNNMASLYSWFFGTVAPDLTPPTVISHSPIGAIVLVSAVVELLFSEAMDNIATQNAFNITPYTPGSFSWNGVDNLTFTPDNDLSYGAEYNITLNGSVASDSNGNFLDGNDNGVVESSPIDDYSWIFTTMSLPPPKVTDNSPIGIGITLSSNISISFNELMNTTSVESAFNITPYATGSFAWDGTQNLTFTPSSPLAYETEYTITINSSVAKCTNANLLDGNENGTADGSPIDDYTWSFTTELAPDTTPPAIETASPTGTNVPITAPITITFNETINQSSIEGAFSMSPTVTGSFSWDGNDFTFTPFSNLTHNASYTVSINGDLAQDLAGNTLDGNNNGIAEGSPTDDYSWSFTTEPDTIPPSVVNDLIAITGTNNGEIDLSWTATGDDGNYSIATSYDIRYSLVTITESDWQNATTITGEPTPGIPGTSEQMTVNGLEPGEAYYFVIKVLDDVSNPSLLSNVANALAKDLTAPTAPAGVTVTEQDNGILIEWSVVTDSDLNYYLVYRSTDNSVFEMVANITASTESYSDTDVTQGTTYYYKITAVD